MLYVFTFLLFQYFSVQGNFSHSFFFGLLYIFISGCCIVMFYGRHLTFEWILRAVLTVCKCEHKPV